MKKYFYILNFIFTIFTFVLQSCENEKPNNVQVENSEKPASILAVENRNKDKKNTYLKNTFVFNFYDDNGDCMSSKESVLFLKECFRFSNIKLSI